jgi:3-dehydroquinate synthase
MNMNCEFIIDDTTVKFSLPVNKAENIFVKSMPYNYNVSFVSKDDLKKELHTLATDNQNKHFVYIDTIVKGIYADDLIPEQPTALIKAKENNKNLATAMKLVDVLQENKYTKKEMLVSIGGGITQDISAFARAVYKRGIDWAYIPTTLLSMADSCIGAKSCLNYKGAKNQLGLFSSPAKVFICGELLKSLHQRDILSGYGEIIKLAIVGGQSTINQFKAYAENQKGDILNNILPIIHLSLSVKNAVIEIDEFEANIRKALNYGHTVGHAIEPLLKYKIPHGIAVSIGMLIENEIAVSYGTLSTDEMALLKNIISPYIDNESINYLKKLNIDDVLNNMKKDKKNLSDEIFMAVPFAIGKFGILKVAADARLSQLLYSSINKLINEREVVN